MPPVPPDRWQPTSLISGWIKDLTRIADQVPPDLQGVYTFSLETLSRIEQWADVPMAVTHTDCWANNAIRTPGGQMVLIDWDGAGLGPAILDVGYLLVACHAFLPEWPQIIPSRERIAAVLNGYTQQRAITSAERVVLVDSIRFAEAFRAAQWMPEGMKGNWRENARFLKFLNRYPVADEIAQIAAQFLARLYKP
jgi:thiamine kinase-like enzyme